MSDDLRKVSGGGALLLGATLAGNGLLLLLDVVQNGLLDQAAYGAWTTLKRTAALLGFVAGLGLENIVLREVAAGRGRGVLRAALAWTTPAAAALGLALYAAVPDSLWVAVSLPFATARLLAVCAAQARGDVRTRAVVMFLAWPLVQFAALPLLPAAQGIPVAYALSMALGALLALSATRHDGEAWARRPGDPAGASLLRQSWPLWLQGMGMAAYTWLDQLLLAALAGTFAAGAYGPVAALAPLYGLGLTALNGRFAPMIAAKHAAGDHLGLQRLYAGVTRLATLLGGPPLAVTLGAAPLVLGLWPGADPQAVPALRIVASAWMGCTLVGSVNYLLIMAGHQRATLANAALGVAVSVGLSFLLVPSLGVTGAALANAGAILAANGLAAWQVWTRLRLTPFHDGLWPPLFALGPGAALAAAGALVPAPPLVQLLAAGALGAAGYVATVLLLGLHPDDRALLRR